MHDNMDADDDGKEDEEEEEKEDAAEETEEEEEEEARKNVLLPCRVDREAVCTEHYSCWHSRQPG